MRSPMTFTILIVFFFLIFSLMLLPSRNAPHVDRFPKKEKKKPDPPAPTADANGVPLELLTGDNIMPELGNATAKAELGRASWKLFHTTLGRFPKKPSKEDSDALNSYLHLFARLYPCGDCAKHFQELLNEYPPQVSSRGAASQWGCFVHNLVNERLKKPEFNCHTIAQAYQCGCEEEDEKIDKKEQAEKLRKQLDDLEREDAAEKKKKLLKAIEELDAEEAKGKDGDEKEKKSDEKESLEEKAKKAGLDVENAGTVNGG